MTLSTHLSFDGNCKEAMEFYSKTFEGTKQMSMTWGESPMAGQAAEGDKDKILYYAIKVGGTTLMGADAMGGHYLKPQGMWVAVSVPEVAKAKQVFDELAAGGSVQMPFAETFWSKGFGMVTDKYDVPWTIDCTEAP